MTLHDWERNGWLTRHQPTADEIDGLLTVIDRDLRDARTRRLSPDWRLNIAYNGALQAATAALAAAGYEPSRDAHHYRAIGSLEYTLGFSEAFVARFDNFRKKRNDAGYERAGVATKQDSREMLAMAKQLRHRLIDWLLGNHRDLLPQRHRSLLARLRHRLAPLFDSTLRA